MGSCILAWDIGGTKIATAAYSPALEPLAFARTVATTSVAQPKALAALAQQQAEELAESGWQVVAAGISVAGSVDAVEGRLIMSPNARWLDGVSLRDLFAATLGAPVAVANDADAFALAEAHAGAAAGMRHVVALTLGTGVGGGLVLNGTLHRGTGIGANELGHLTINYRGPRCSCGSRGCLEAYCGGWAIPRQAARLLSRFDGDTCFAPLRDELAHLATHDEDDDAMPTLSETVRQQLDGAALCDAAATGDAFAQRFWHHYGEWMGAALASLVNVVRPEAFVFGGAGARSLPHFEARMHEVVTARVMPPLFEALAYLPAAAAQAGTLGAALVAKELTGKSP